MCVQTIVYVCVNVCVCAKVCLCVLAAADHTAIRLLIISDNVKVGVLCQV
jgi:hypothetical protein